jgi:hypothetical protein
VQEKCNDDDGGYSGFLAPRSDAKKSIPAKVERHIEGELLVCMSRTGVKLESFCLMPCLSLH